MEILQFCSAVFAEKSVAIMTFSTAVRARTCRLFPGNLGKFHGYNARRYCNYAVTEDHDKCSQYLAYIGLR